MEVSIVIPTKDRVDDLNELLNSILRQTALPKEVIVVDDSENCETRKLITQKNEDFLRKGTSLKYLHGNEKNKGISVARNIGAINSSGEIICFIDDDIILHRDFIKEILRVYETYPNAMGVQGYVVNARPYSVLSNALNKVCADFPRTYFERNKCITFPFVYPYPLTRMIECEWSRGTNSSYKKEILKNFKFDEKLKGYSLCEDMDISYRIQKRYPHSLYITPYARAFHKNSTVARISDKHFIYKMAAYPTYFFYKNIKQTLLNNIIFYWGFFVGSFVLKIIQGSPKEIIFSISACLKTLKHFKSIRNGDFKF